MPVAPMKILTVIRTYDFAQCIDALGVAGMFLCGFGMLFKKSVAHFGLILMAFSFLLNYKKLRREDIRDPLLALSVAFLLFIFIRGIFAALEYPSHKTLILEGSLKLLGTGFFLTYLFAYWMHRAKDKWNELLIVIMAGYLVQILRNIEWGNLSEFIFRLWTGTERATFGFATNRFGLFSAVILLACLVLYRQIWGAPEKNVWHRPRIAFWVVICCLSSMGVIFSQSRSAWLAALIVIPVSLLFNIFGPSYKKNLKWKPLLLVGVLLAIAFSTANLSKIVEKRTSGGIDAVSISARLSLYQIAWENWKEQPWVGRGPGTSWIMIQEAGEEYAAVKLFDHLHNIFFDIAAQVGVVGIAFLILSFCLVIRQAFQAKYAESFHQNFILFALGGSAIMLIAGIPNQPFHSPHGVYLFGYLGGICYSLKLTDVHP